MRQYVVGNAPCIVSHAHDDAAVFGSKLGCNLMRARLCSIDNKIIEYDKKVVVSLNQNITLQMDVETCGGNRFTCAGLQYPANLREQHG